MNVLKVGHGELATSRQVPVLYGHSIAFPQDGLGPVVRQLPNVDHVRRTFAVSFIGSAEQREQALRAAFRSPVLRCRSSAVFRFLAIKRALDPAWAARMRDAVDRDTAVAVDALEAQLRRDALEATGEYEIEMERRLMSDVAEVRSRGTAGQEGLASTGTSLLTPRQGTEFIVGEGNGEDENRGIDAGTLARSRMLRGLRRSLGIGDPEDGEEAVADWQHPARITRRNDPVSEFDDNQRIAYGAFGHLFLRGCGVPADGRFTARLDAHLMRQHSGVFSQDPHFAFWRFNQVGRTLVLVSHTLLANLWCLSAIRIVEGSV
jgi:hypothetical protein